MGCTGEAAPVVAAPSSGGVLSAHSTLEPAVGSLFLPLCGMGARATRQIGGESGLARGRPWNAARADGRVGSSCSWPPVGVRTGSSGDFLCQNIPTAGLFLTGYVPCIDPISTQLRAARPPLVTFPPCVTELPYECMWMFLSLSSLVIQCQH